MGWLRVVALLSWAGWLMPSTARAEGADVILHHGRIVSVDANFTIHDAIVIGGERIEFVGSNQEALAHAGPETELVDLGGKMVLPGLIDSHVHPNGAAMHEFDHAIPEMNSIADVLDYVRSRAAIVPEGEWISVSQVFITRLAEQRYPTRQELDQAAPRHPVIFATGPDASVNSLALDRSGIDRNFTVIGSGYVEMDGAGEPTGILRSSTRYLKVDRVSSRSASEEDRYERLRMLLKDYNATGITAIADRNASSGDVDRYRGLLAQGNLTVRVAVSRNFDSSDDPESIAESIRQIAADPLTRGHQSAHEAPPMLSIVGIKTFLDGGMLTGSAYMRHPWGISQIYGIRDPDYRGVLFIERDRLLAMVHAACESGLQFTAHCAGDSAVELLVDVYSEIDRDLPVRPLRPCVTHANFHDPATIQRAASLGVVMDIQPIWLYMDAKTLLDQFGSERLRYFHPLATLRAAGVTVGGGSDHMQKVGRDRSVNPYNPFLGIETAVTRRARGMDEPLHPEESLSREQALRMYTIDNAWLLFMEGDIGSLEPGKLADLIVVDRDLLSCPTEDVDSTQVLATYLGGKKVYP